MDSVVPASTEASATGSIPTPSSSTVISANSPESVAVRVILPPPGLDSSPWRTAFSTSGCRLRNGMAVESTSGATARDTRIRSPKRAFSSSR